MTTSIFRPTVFLTLIALLALNPVASGQESEGLIRVGMIGLDTSHSIAFTRLMNDPKAESPIQRCRVVCAYPHGSADIESSVSRIPKYTEEIKSMGVEIVDSIDDLISKVDVVLLETNDGRIHLEQVLPVLKAHKPVFIDKPIAASLTDVIAIFEAAEHFDTPVFSSSSLRFAKPAQAARRGELVGKVIGCETFSPAKLEPTHPDLYWYGIHGVEQLFTVLGGGCQSVSRTSTDSTDVVVGKWNDGRIGTFRGTRKGPSNYGGTVFGEKGQASTGGNEGYVSLVNQIGSFFESHQSPVTSDETIEIYAFMTAADESKKNGGAPVLIADVIEEAKGEASKRLLSLGVDIPKLSKREPKQSVGDRDEFEAQQSSAFTRRMKQPVRSRFPAIGFSCAAPARDAQ